MWHVLCALGGHMSYECPCVCMRWDLVYGQGPLVCRALPAGGLSSYQVIKYQVPSSRSNHPEKLYYFFLLFIKTPLHKGSEVREAWFDFMLLRGAVTKLWLPPATTLGSVCRAVLQPYPAARSGVAA